GHVLDHLAADHQVRTELRHLLAREVVEVALVYLRPVGQPVVLEGLPGRGHVLGHQVDAVISAHLAVAQEDACQVPAADADLEESIAGPDEVDGPAEARPVRRRAVQLVDPVGDRRARLQRRQLVGRAITLRSPSPLEQPLRLPGTEGAEHVHQLPATSDQRLLPRRRVLGHDYSRFPLGVGGSLARPLRYPFGLVAHRVTAPARRCRRILRRDRPRSGDNPPMSPLPVGVRARLAAVRDRARSPRRPGPRASTSQLALLKRLTMQRRYTEAVELAQRHLTDFPRDEAWLRQAVATCGKAGAVTSQ